MEATGVKTLANALNTVPMRVHLILCLRLSYLSGVQCPQHITLNPKPLNPP